MSSQTSNQGLYAGARRAPIRYASPTVILVSGPHAAGCPHAKPPCASLPCRWGTEINSVMACSVLPASRLVSCFLSLKSPSTFADPIPPFTDINRHCVYFTLFGCNVSRLGSSYLCIKLLNNTKYSKSKYYYHENINIHHLSYRSISSW
jgi:hypothetical protein